MEATGKNTETKYNGITEGVIWKQLLVFFFPLLFGSFFQQLYTTIDAIVVGRFVGKVALSAVGGTTGTIINLFIGFFIGISSGATVVISQFYGGNEDLKVEKAVHTTVTLALVGGTAIMLVGLAGAPWILEAMGTPKEVMGDSLIFIRIYFCGTVPNLIYNMGSGILRAIGDSRRPLHYLIASCFVNILLDIILVIWLRLGVAGAAAATALSQLLSAVLVCMALMRSKGSYRLYMRRIRFHRRVLVRILKLGLPAGIQSMMYALSNIVIQSNINSFGTDTIAAWTAFGKIDGLFWMMISSFGVAITIFTGQNFGARKPDRVRRGMRECLGMAMASSIILSLVLYLSGEYIYRLFTEDAAVIANGMTILHFLLPTYFTYVCTEIFSGTLRGMGDSLVPMLIICSGLILFRGVWLFLAVPVWPGLRTVLACYPLTWMTTSVLFAVYYNYYVKMKKIGI